MTVFRKWPFRSLAICPFGHDSGTHAKFSDDDANVDIAVTVNPARKELDMPKNTTDPSTDGSKRNRSRTDRRPDSGNKETGD